MIEDTHKINWYQLSKFVLSYKQSAKDSKYAKTKEVIGVS
jgi:hypothetical protein